jgi:hypothetical protein
VFLGPGLVEKGESFDQYSLRHELYVAAMTMRMAEIIIIVAILVAVIWVPALGMKARMIASGIMGAGNGCQARQGNAQ